MEFAEIDMDLLLNQVVEIPDDDAVPTEPTAAALPDLHCARCNRTFATATHLKQHMGSKAHADGRAAPRKRKRAERSANNSDSEDVSSDESSSSESSVSDEKSISKGRAKPKRRRAKRARAASTVEVAKKVIPTTLGEFTLADLFGGTGESPFVKATQLLDNVRGSTAQAAHWTAQKEVLEATEKSTAAALVEKDVEIVTRTQSYKDAQAHLDALKKQYDAAKVAEDDAEWELSVSTSNRTKLLETQKGLKETKAAVEKKEEDAFTTKVKAGADLAAFKMTDPRGEVILNILSNGDKNASARDMEILKALAVAGPTFGLANAHAKVEGYHNNYMGTSVKTVASLPVRIIAENCPICIDVLKNGAPVFMASGCHHGYHNECLIAFARRKESNYQRKVKEMTIDCSLCRAKICFNAGTTYLTRAPTAAEAGKV